jgi:hypothetical protein
MEMHVRRPADAMPMPPIRAEQTSEITAHFRREPNVWAGDLIGWHGRRSSLAKLAIHAGILAPPPT